MRTVYDKHTNKYLKYAMSQLDVTRYLWKYHTVSTDIMKCSQSWYIRVNGQWFGVGSSILDSFPIQHWATIYKYLVDNPESIVYCMSPIDWESYLLKSNRDITIDHSKYKSYIN